MNYLTEKEQSEVDEIFTLGATVDLDDEYWIHGSDEGMSFCLDCARKKVAELLAKEPDGDYCVAGGYGIEGDSTPFCETCQKMLSNSFTQCACECELDHFEESGFDPSSSMDCYSMERVIGSSGWGPLIFEHDPEWRRKDLAEYYERLHALGRKILASREPKGEQ